MIPKDAANFSVELTEQRKNELKKQINYLRLSLWQIHTEVEAKLGETDYSEELLYSIMELKQYTSQLEKVWKEQVQREQ